GRRIGRAGPPGPGPWRSGTTARRRARGRLRGISRWLRVRSAEERQDTAGESEERRPGGGWPRGQGRRIDTTKKTRAHARAADPAIIGAPTTGSFGAGSAVP